MSKDNFTVRLTESDEAHDLTPYATSLTFKDVDPGGFAGASFDLDRAIDARAFEDFADVAVFDNATGEQVGGGRLLRPGRGVDPTGKGVWKMETLGEGVAHAQERVQPYYLADATFDGWSDGDGTSKSRSWSVGTSPDHGAFNPEEGFIFSIQQSTTGINAFSNADNYNVREMDQFIGGFKYVWRPGRVDTDNVLEGQLRPNSGAPLDISVQTWSTTAERTVNEEVGTHWSGDYSRLNLVYVRQDTTLTPIETDYILVKSVLIQARRLDRNGDDIEGGGNYTKGYVTTEEAVIDAVARFCPRFDLVNARIDEGDFHHTTLKWLEGESTYGVFEYLQSIEPEFTWAVWERQENGQWNFEWRERDTDVRYEFGDASECSFEFTGGEEERLVKFWFTGENTVGRYKASQYTADNPFAARDIFPTGTGPITLANTSEWDAEAAALAAQEVENSQFTATAAQAVLRNWVYDHYAGRWIPQHMVKAGYLGRITNVRPQGDTLNNPDLQDNNVILRVVSKEYNVETEETALELNAYTLSEARAIANLLAKAA